MKINKKLLILTTLIILVPMIVGIYYWNELPDVIATHWNVHNEPDGFSSKPFTVFGMPLILACIHLLCACVYKIDPKNKKRNEKGLRIVLWITPSVALVVQTAIYGVALGEPVNISRIVTIFMGIMFIAIGNYMPKFEQNYTVGLKLPWTLESKDNWYKTHRLGGLTMTIAGILTVILSLFGIYVLILPIIILSTIIPIIYSYLYYKKEQKSKYEK